ncbi:hypothetical protein [Chamaesiphon minutus]|uniref:Uncharacterized protein n=1 Tax=Chamaesiphon minutus (strain ATCC 27169 / PCC 6605) TaxID=1173020 RepID=K9UP08_CHAP6|nr:hypothetical protein [Chamaesiphon minutus]AFY96408.1 hypothetical protein Cha6605_5528 [Chamaesiphon minutus PCC 6605]
MNCVLLEEMALYGVAGEPAYIDNIFLFRYSLGNITIYSFQTLNDYFCLAN